jgi:serine/threonine protein phosphatase PrpC
MKYISCAKTDIGKKRDHNEDSYLLDLELDLFVVADGMGGHAAGEVASREAVEALRDNVLAKKNVLQSFLETPDNDTAELVRKNLELAVRVAGYQVFGMTEIDPDRKGMGTTLSLLLLTPTAAFIAHVGDSRIYMIREGKYRLATHDHTYVATMVKQGKMTEEQAQRSRYSSVLLRAVGPHDYVQVDTRILRHKIGDVFLLCSDGLHGYLQDGELTNYVDVRDLPGSMDRLIRMALDRGGKDNITGILVRIDP